MIVNSLVVPGLNDKYKTLHVKLAESLNLIVVFGEFKITIWKVYQYGGKARILLAF